MGRRRPQKQHQPLLIPQTGGSRPPAPHLRGLLLPRPRPGWGCPLHPRAGAPWTGLGGRSSRGCSDGTRSSWWKGEGGCWAPSPGGPPAHFPQGATPYLRCLLLEGPCDSGPRLWAASFWFRSCKGEGAAGRGQEGQTLLGPTQSCAGGWTGCFVDSSAPRPGSPVSTPGASASRDPRHTRTQLPPPQLALGGLSAQVFTPEPAPWLRLSSQQTSSAAGPPDALRLPLCPQRPETLPHPLTPRGPLAPSPAPAWLSRPFGVCPCPRPTTPQLQVPSGSSPSLCTAQLPQYVRAPAPPAHQAGNTTFSLNVATAKL